jgi:hypothetical protein
VCLLDLTKLCGNLGFWNLPQGASVSMKHGDMIVGGHM